MHIFSKLIIVVVLLVFSHSSYANLACELNVCKLKASKDMDFEKVTKAFAYHNNRLGWSALNYAIEMRDYQSANILCDFLIDINQKDGLYATNPGSIYKANALERILLIAWFNNRQKKLEAEQVLLIEKLLDSGIEFDTTSGTGLLCPIIYLAYFGEIELVGRLLDMGVDVNKENGRPLNYALCTGNVQLFDYLIMRGADVRLVDMLHDAILGQKIELVRFALDYGCDINSFDAVKLAMGYTWGEVEKVYLKPDCETPALEIVHFLLENGADPNFWISDALAKGKALNEAFKDSPIGYALDLSKKVSTFQQICYRQCLINLLRNYGAVMDKP